MDNFRKLPILISKNTLMSIQSVYDDEIGISDNLVVDLTDVELVIWRLQQEVTLRTHC